MLVRNLLVLEGTWQMPEQNIYIHICIYKIYIHIYIYTYIYVTTDDILIAVRNEIDSINSLVFHNWFISVYIYIQIVYIYIHIYIDIKKLQ